MSRPTSRLAVFAFHIVSSVVGCITVLSSTTLTILRVLGQFLVTLLTFIADFCRKVVSDETRAYYL